MQRKAFLIILLVVNTYLFAQYTQVPDPNFEQALIDLGIDSEGTLDGQFLTADALGVIVLDVRYKNINDLTGLEAFVDLHDLLASHNNLTQIDLSVLPTTMWTIRLSYNGLTTIDLSPLTNVVNLYLGVNQLTSVNVSNLPQLFAFGVQDQPITSLSITNCLNLYALGVNDTPMQTMDFSDIPNLGVAYCENSQFHSLDFSDNPNLEYLLAYNLPLTSINLPNNPNLEELYIHSCQLTELDVTSCTALWYLGCSDNNLTTLDLSGNPNLEDLRCYDNQLTALDVSNNPNLWRLWCFNNFISGDFTLLNNILLEEISCRNNLFSNLDLSSCSLLVQGSVHSNPNLEIINLKNGGNENMSSFSAYNCPNLSCVVVDDPEAPNENIITDDAVFVGDIADCEGISVSEFEIEEQILLYPNPVLNRLHIDFDQNLTITEISFFSYLGKKVWQTDNVNNPVDVSSLKPGLYLVQIKTKKGIVNTKMIRE